MTFSLKGWSPEDVANPYPVYQRYRDQGSVQRGDGGAWYVFGYDEVHAALSSPDFGRGSGGPIPPSRQELYRIVQNWLVFMDPPRHTTLRRLLSTEFSPKVVTGLRGRISVIADALIAAIADRTTVDLVEDFAAPLPVLVISELLGVPAERQDWFRERAIWLQEASSARAGGQADSQDLPDRAAGELAAYFGELVEQRRDEPRDDLVSLLAHAVRRGEPVTDDEVVGTCVHLLTAGHETTTNLLAKSVPSLLSTPDVLRRLRSDPGLLPTAVDELVRHDPPVQMVTRTAYRDRTLGGKRIGEGDKVVLVLGSANRDHSRFEDPDELKLTRPAGRQCGFGIGIHYCLGANLARAEAEIGLNSFLSAFPELGLGDEAVTYGEDMVFHGPTRVPLRTRTKE